MSGTDDTVTDSGATHRPAVSMPRTVGRYQLGEQLGAGGMGQVFRGHDPRLNREVAIKILHPGAGDERRLLREAQAMARLSHPNLAVVHDVGVERGEVFVAMELIDGTTLKTWLAAPRPWRERLAAVIAAGRGLVAAHAAGVIHRDFKPDNVLVARDGAVKVVDFGLARGVGETVPAPEGDDVLHSPMTLTGTVMGTPAYMAPEQWAGEPADARADQFSFAVTMYEAIYRHRPFEPGSTELEPMPPGDAPPALWAAITRGLAADPKARHPSIEAMLDAVAAATARRRRWWIVALAGAVVAIAAVAIALASREPAPRRGHLAPEAVDAVVAQHAGQLHVCHRAALSENSQLGDVTARIAIVIEPDGHVSSVAIEDRGAPTSTLAGCITARILEWTFPPPDGHARVQISHDFAFVQPPSWQVALVDGVYQIPRATFEAWKADPRDLLSTAKPVPSKKEGVPYGWKLYGIPDGSALEALGLVDGDTLISIGGVALGNDAAILFEVLDRVGGATAIDVVLMRRGVEQTLRYAIAG